MSRDWRTWIEIDENAYAHNVGVFKELAGKQTKLMPIVKSNAYGHGLKEAALLAQKWPIWGLGVAYGDEALKLRKYGYRGKIAVLSWWNARLLPILAKKSIEIVIYDFTTLNSAIEFVKKERKQLKAHIKVDVGTTRIGFRPEDIKKAAKILSQVKKINIVGVWSHLSSSEEKSERTTKDQIKLFNELARYWPKAKNHISCTAAMIRYPESRMDIARLGIGLYGIWPSPETKEWAKEHHVKIKIRPVLKWMTRISQIKTVPKGTAIGYGRTAITKTSTKIGVIPVGYADGLDRRASNKLQVVVNGKMVPIIGRVCMNLAMVDLKRIKVVRAGDEVTIIGGKFTAEKQSEDMGMIPYEFVSRLAPDIKRIVV